MKLWSSFVKELKLASTSFYFYIEIGMAFIILFLLIFVIVDDFGATSTEYLYLDMPDKVKDIYINEIETSDEIIIKESREIELKKDNKIAKTVYLELNEKKIYIFAKRQDMVQATKEKKNLGVSIHLNSKGEFKYTYYLQGYESERLKNLYRIFHSTNVEEIMKKVENQEVEYLSKQEEILSDKENTIPAFLTFNGSLMGLFIIAAYIFLDKQEGVIKAYAVTASSVWHYLLSKVFVIMFTSTITSLIIVIPIMKMQPNYFIMLVFLLTSGFFASSLGLLIASFYDNIIQAFGAIYVVMMVMLLPNIAYFMPSWDPVWLRIFPSYPMLYSFKEAIKVNGDINYVLMMSVIFFLIGLLLFVFSNYRYKKTLSM